MTREAFDVIIRPLLTEKLTDMRETQRKIGLLVRADANKVEIKKATERALNVNALNGSAFILSRNARVPSPVVTCGL